MEVLKLMNTVFAAAAASVNLLVENLVADHERTIFMTNSQGLQPRYVKSTTKN